MNIQGVDERHVASERESAAFLLFIYEGGDKPHYSWSVDSQLILDAQLEEVLGWLPSVLPENCCWALAVVTDPRTPSTESDLRVAWIVGADLLNTKPEDRSPREDYIVEAMLTRRHRVTFN